jgi:7-keto-8-aminopelargonate synthetase-like enzyme
MAAPHEAPLLRQVSPTEVEWRGRRLAYFGGSDYFRLSWHPQVRAAVATAQAEEGHNVAASRMTTGNHPLYGELERSLAKFFGAPAALVTATGYTAPLVAAQALAGLVTHVIVDERAHNCLKDAARLSGVEVISFAHRNIAALAQAIRATGRRAQPVVFTDGLSPLDGTVPPLADYLAVLPANAWLLVDDAHGVGTLGKRGRGVLEVLGKRDPRVLLTLTLSKAFGAYGGAVLGPKWLRERMVAHSGIYSGSTPLPPPLAAAAQTALALLHGSGESLRARLRANTLVVKEAFRATHPDWLARPGPTFTVSFCEPRKQEQLRRRLLAADIYPTLIRYRNGPADCFFRFAIASEHTPRQLTALRDVLAEFAADAV